MEPLNRIELRGIVGSIRTSNVSNTRVANFSVATNYSYTDKDGRPVIETTWHYVTAYGISNLEKGDKVHVLGRLRARRYLSSDGVERMTYEVIANKVDLI